MKNHLIILFYYFFLITSCTIQRQKVTVATFKGEKHHFFNNQDYWEFKDLNGESNIVKSWRPSTGKGSKYVIIYDSVHPHRFKIDKNKPVILQNEVSVFTIGVVTSEHQCFKPHQQKCTITYTYEVNHTEHFGEYQFDNQYNDTICISKGDKYEIEYSKLNPKRSIFHLEKPDVEYSFFNPSGIKFYHDDKLLDERHEEQKLKEDLEYKTNAIQNKFKGHLAGIDIGYAKVNNSTFLDRNVTNKGLYEMSLNIFFYDRKFPIYKEYVGITTGIGLSDLNVQIINNQDIYRNQDSVWVQKNQSKTYDHNVLDVGFISIPVMLELNSHQNPRKTFFILAGLTGGVKIYSLYQKITSHSAVENNTNKINYPTGNIGLNYFKLDASLRMGYKFFGFYANYSLTPLFNSHLTRAVYPLSFGFSFVF